MSVTTDNGELLDTAGYDRIGDPFVSGGAGGPPGEWRPLFYLNVYRLFVAGLFLILSGIGLMPRAIDGASPVAFKWTAATYLILTIAAWLAIRRKSPGFEAQVVLHAFADIFALTLLMHMSGGVNSGIGVLLVITVGGMSLIAPGKISTLFAAVATVAVLAERLSSALVEPVPVADYTQAGLLGAAFFGAAFLGHLAASRLRASEALVAEREIDLRDLAELNQHIIHRMQSGIVVATARGDVRLLNESARKLLKLDRVAPGTELRSIAPSLDILRRRWNDSSGGSSFTFSDSHVDGEVTVSFAGLGANNRAGVLMFLEDVAMVRQRAQQLKLAALGRLTASIAHEIRNPLGAISHAEQLLSESEVLDAPDRRLVDIIHDNCKRMDVIIEDVLSLSRRGQSTREALALHEWLPDFREHFFDSHDAVEAEITIAVDPSELVVRFDKDHLRQVLLNLVENGVRHAVAPKLVRLDAGVLNHNERPYIDVFDNGAGVRPEDAEHIFDPFFTTRASGTGLGLYIAKDLCEANQATLDLIMDEQQPSAGGRSSAHGMGCRFRITFSDPRRLDPSVGVVETPAATPAATR